MKSRMMKSCCLLGVLLLACAGTLMAQDDASKFTASASIDYANKYVWRGQNLNNESVLQYNASGSIYGFTGAIWANMPLTNRAPNIKAFDNYPSQAGEFDEIDYSLDYTRAFPNSDKVSFSLGIIRYTFEGHGDDQTTEIYGGLSFDVPLSPSVTWYRDVDVINGSYIALGLGHTFEKLHSWSDDEYISLEVTGNIGIGGSGYNGCEKGSANDAGYFCDAADDAKYAYDDYGLTYEKDHFDMNKTKFNDLTLNVALPIALKHGFSITPSFHFSTMLSGSIRDSIGYVDKVNDKAKLNLSDDDRAYLKYEDASYNGRHTNYWFGVNITKSF